MRMNLKVPFAEKEQAKKLGARWDAARKVWYVAGDADLKLFSRWSPTADDGAVAATPPAQAAAAKKPPTAGKFSVGSAFVDQPRICDCLPWEVCDKCEPTSLNRKT